MNPDEEALRIVHPRKDRGSYPHLPDDYATMTPSSDDLRRDDRGLAAYFKATRLDGRDFRTGTVDYGAALATGEILRHPAPKKIRNYAETYLSISTSAADCTGFSWPCRLFRVEPVGRIVGAGKVPLLASPNKRAVSALRVVEEVPAWQAFGPNGEAVIPLLERCRTLTPDEIDRLDAAWYSARNAAWYSAWNAAGNAARNSARNAAWNAAGNAAWNSAWNAAGNAARDAARNAAGNAAWNAAGALVVRDLITPEQFDLLHGPWASVMEVTP